MHIGYISGTYHVHIRVISGIYQVHIRVILGKYQVLSDTYQVSWKAEVTQYILNLPSYACLAILVILNEGVI